MNIRKITSIYFSPNGSTNRIVKKIVKGIGIYENELLDLTYPKARDTNREFGEDELVVIGFPVYADRLPTISEEIFEKISGNNTPAVIVVSYGNRDYGDALLELKNKLEKRSFKTIAAAAIVGEHCLNTNIASDRPDSKDHLKILDFGKKINEKIKNIKDLKGKETIEVKGKYPYQPLKTQRAPRGDSKCIQCGICEANCPVNAISLEDFKVTDGEICIFCGKCIQVCPTHARDIKDKDFIKLMKKLETIAGERREIEEFF